MQEVQDRTESNEVQTQMQNEVQNEIKVGKLEKDALLVFKRNGKGMPRLGKVISGTRANSKKVKVTIPGMESNTTFPVGEPLFELKVLVTKDILDALENIQEDLE